MDIEGSFGEEIVLVPRRFPLNFCRIAKLEAHYAVLGMAAVMDGYPLYADAVNEKGLGMAGLHFPDNAYYRETEAKGKYHVAPFELIPWVLSRCATVEEARTILEKTSLIAVPFREDIPLSPLHWLIADRYGAVVLEATRSGLHIYENKTGILTNNPPFPFHLKNLCQYGGLTNTVNKTEFSESFGLLPFGMGLGAFGLPGDYSSASRFVKAAFLTAHTAYHEDATENVTEFFHLLSSVAPVGSSVLTSEGKTHITIYSCCMDAEKGVYYYNTYYNHQITAVDMHKENLDGTALGRYPLIQGEQIRFQN
jgi:choloylglycine hydrolase